jgi:ribosome maturation factor RimP
MGGFQHPAHFFRFRFLMSWQQAIERTVTGLGYDLVDVERLARGLLRVTIDRLPGRVYGAPGAPDAGEFVTVDDCERVTRQLQYALEVAGMAYERLEVSSPGLDRPLKTEDHYRRFAGQAVSLTLKLPFQGRKHWTGVLQPREGGWRLEITDGKTESALDFAFDEVRETRLVPVIDFKGRRKNKDAVAAPAADTAQNGEQEP